MASSAEMFHPANPHIDLLRRRRSPHAAYLAQGAGMALEDAQALAVAIGKSQMIYLALQLARKTAGSATPKFKLEPIATVRFSMLNHPQLGARCGDEVVG